MKCLLKDNYFDYIKVNKANLYDVTIFLGYRSFDIFKRKIRVIEDYCSYDVHFGDYLIKINIKNMDEIMVCNEEEFNDLFISKEDNLKIEIKNILGE